MVIYFWCPGASFAPSELRAAREDSNFHPPSHFVLRKGRRDNYGADGESRTHTSIQIHASEACAPACRQAGLPFGDEGFSGYYVIEVENVVISSRN